MKQQTTPAIILRRTNYGEADRIISFITPLGKVRALVKGVRRSKSKLAGGIELFSETTITFLTTRGDLARIISTRLEQHWAHIVGDLPRMMFGYEAMKLIDKAIEDAAERDYFELLKTTLAALDEPELPLSGVETWFYLRFLKLHGSEPNLKTDPAGRNLRPDTLYTFSVDDMCFAESLKGSFRAEHIKLLRLLLTHQPAVLQQIKQATELTSLTAPLFKQLTQQLIS